MTSSFFLILIFTLLLISQSHAQPTCVTQKFTNRNHYDHCVDLPQLGAFLHWSLNTTNNTVSIVFIAPPGDQDGWISWAINPSGLAMVGSQALLAYKETNGTMSVKTYNISSTSFGSIKERKLDFDVKDTRGEYENGVMRIFGTVGLLEEGQTTVNQVWQIGGAVNKDGTPARHAFLDANLEAVGRLDLLSGEISSGGNGNLKIKKNVNCFDNT